MRFKQFKIITVDIDVIIGIPQFNKWLRDFEVSGNNVLDIDRKGNVYDITYQISEEEGNQIEFESHRPTVDE